MGGDKQTLDVVKTLGQQLNMHLDNGLILQRISVMILSSFISLDVSRFFLLLGYYTNATLHNLRSTVLSLQDICDIVFSVIFKFEVTAEARISGFL